MKDTNSTPKKRQILVDYHTWKEISHLAIDLDLTSGDVVIAALSALKEKRSNSGATQASV